MLGLQVYFSNMIMIFSLNQIFPNLFLVGVGFKNAA